MIKRFSALSIYFLCIAHVPLCAMNSIDNDDKPTKYTIQNSNGKSCMMAIEEVSKFNVLKQLIEDCSSETSDVLEIPQLNITALKDLLTLITYARIKKRRSERLIAMLEVADFLGLNQKFTFKSLIYELATTSKNVHSQQKAFYCLRGFIKLNNDLHVLFNDNNKDKLSSLLARGYQKNFYWILDINQKLCTISL